MSSSSIMERSGSSDGMDYSGDAAFGSFFNVDFKRNDDLKQMLDGNRDHLKLVAMKRIIGMIAKGRDASDLFPAVVKNVVSKNTEVKKLVYVYLVRYAEEQQDLALLSISTFQRALKDPNQLIRASALRVLSSIRVSVIVPIVMLAIRESSADMSPYVRKTAAHAIPKLYSLDADQKDELIQILDKLLADRTTLVVGSAVMAFEEVCPERIDLIHKNYRKLCSLLVDVDEWGQVVIVNMLTRYARTQFLDPNVGDMTIDGVEKPFYEEDDKGEEHEEEGDGDVEDAVAGSKAKDKDKNVPPQMDSDHRLILKNSRPLLQSRNAAVVMSVVQLYHHLAPKSEVHVVIRPLIRLLRSHAEVQTVVLTCIAAMSTNRKSLFEPYMKSFFVRSSDPTQVKLFKLEILTNIANESNIQHILREFQTYISSQDKVFVAATIEAIGRCASSIKEVAQTCLNGLVALLSHRDPAVVGGAVVVAKTLLQTQRSGNRSVIAQLAKMVDRVNVAPARAAILWLLGEHAERLPNLPPDVLRKMAKTFPDEEDIVKLQIINLSAKLQLTNPTQTTLLCQYILNLAKYDQSYDIRDRARFLRNLLFPENPESKLAKYAKKILLASKPAPVLQSKFKDRDHFQLGSLSHFLNARATGYQDLPQFPLEAPDQSVRNVEPPPQYSPEKSTFPTDSKISKTGKKKSKQSGKKKSFYSDSGSAASGSESGTADSESDSSSSSSSDSESGSSTKSDASSENSGSSVEEAKVKPTTTKGKSIERKVVRYNEAGKMKSRGSESGSDSESGSGSSSSDEDSNDSEESSSSSSSSTKKVKTKKSYSKNVVVESKKTTTAKAKETTKGVGKKEKNVDLLFDFDADEASAMEGRDMDGTSSNPFSLMSSTLLSPSTGNNFLGDNDGASLGKNLKDASNKIGSIQSASPMYIPEKSTELLNKIVTGGLQGTYRFTRAPHLFSPSLVSIELQFTNLSKEALKGIQIGEKMLPTGMTVHDMPVIPLLEPGKSATSTIGIDFNDTTQGAKIEILWGTEAGPKKQTVTIKAPGVGELIRPVTMSESTFIAEQGKLRGMTEHETKTFINTDFTSSRPSLLQKVYETGNLVLVPTMDDDLVRFAGQALSSRTLVLVSIHLAKDEEEGREDKARIIVNCEKMVMGSLLLQELKEALALK